MVNIDKCQSPDNFGFTFVVCICKIMLRVLQFFVTLKHWVAFVTGHCRLHRITLAERDEQKKRDREQEKQAKKKDRDEEEVDRSQWCKYTLGLKHQVCGNWE